MYEVKKVFLLKPLWDLVTFIHDYALDELYDIKKIKQQIMELQIQLELEEITDAEYEKQESVLVERMKQAIIYHKNNPDENS